MQDLTPFMLRQEFKCPIIGMEPQDYFKTGIGRFGSPTVRALSCAHHYPYR